MQAGLSTFVAVAMLLIAGCNKNNPDAASATDETATAGLSDSALSGPGDEAGVPAGGAMATEDDIPLRDPDPEPDEEDEEGEDETTNDEESDEEGDEFDNDDEGDDDAW